MDDLGAQELPPVQIHPEAASEACAPLHLRAVDLPGHFVWLESHQRDFCGVSFLHGFPGPYPQGGGAKEMNLIFKDIHGYSRNFKDV